MNFSLNGPSEANSCKYAPEYIVPDASQPRFLDGKRLQLVSLDSVDDNALLLGSDSIVPIQNFALILSVSDKVLMWASKTYRQDMRMK